jgi:hypothetical protein
LHCRLETSVLRRQASIPLSALSRLSLVGESGYNEVELATPNAIKNQAVLISQHTLFYGQFGDAYGDCSIRPMLLNASRS